MNEDVFEIRFELNVTHHHCARILIDNNDLDTFNADGYGLYVGTSVQIFHLGFSLNAERSQGVVQTCRLNQGVYARALEREKLSIEAPVVRIPHDPASSLGLCHTLDIGAICDAPLLFTTLLCLTRVFPGRSI